jgi:hypothetical protein
MMRPYRIQYMRYPNLRQHVVLRSKNRTDHALPSPDISLATDKKIDLRLRGVSIWSSFITVSGFKDGGE